MNKRSLSFTAILAVCAFGLHFANGAKAAAPKIGAQKLSGLYAYNEGEEKKEEDKDKTLSPYFFVQSDDPTVDKMPLKSTQADVKIAGVIADVSVTQVYKNEGKKNLEAIYIFPLSTRAAVYAMKMTIGTRIIEAEMKKREEAKEIYETAKKEGKTASLLEQQKPNVFQMNVANILPGDEIKVEMKYVELIEPEDNTYEFVYPTVVGPRYSNKPKEGATDTQKWVENPYLHEGASPNFTFYLSAEINSGMPISKVVSPSHDIGTEFTGKSQVHVTIKPDGKESKKDFILRYQLAGAKIESGLLLYEGKEENFFLLNMEPPDRVVPKEIVSREYIFILDVSGSMHGFPLDISKALMKDILGGLRPNDYFNVLLFSGGSAVLNEKESLAANEANKQTAINWINSQYGGGGTELLPALKRAMSLPAHPGTSRIITIATDGYVDVEPEAFELIRANLNKANFFSFGIGSSVNRHLIEGMAKVGMGEAFVVLNPQAGPTQAEKFRKYVEAPVLTGVKAKFEGFSTYDVEPIELPDLFAQKPISMFGKWKGGALGKIVITGKTADGDFKQEVSVNGAIKGDANAALRLLWARHRIMRLADLNDLNPYHVDNKVVEDRKARIKEITDLGLKYSLMTQFTSFVAVDKIKRADGKVETVKQPLPLPEGVSDYAVGNQAFSGLGMTGVGKGGGGAGYGYGGSMGAKSYKSAPSKSYKTETAVDSMAYPKEESLEAAGDEDKKDKSKPSALKVAATLGGVKEFSDADKKKLAENVKKFEAMILKLANEEQSKNASFKGVLIVKLTVDKEGKVKKVDFLQKPSASGDFIDDVKKTLSGVKFMKPQKDEGEITIKFVIAP